MAKKVVNLSKEYLEKKIVEMETRQRKIIDLIDQYSELYTKIEGALESLHVMLEDLNSSEIKIEETKIE
jgi:hypothetical protein